MAHVRSVRLAGRETSKKRSGRQLDEKKDFNEATRKEPEQISAAELEAHKEIEKMPSQIRDGLISVTFVKPHLDVEKDKRTAALELSLELTEDHLDYLPKRVQQAWEAIESDLYKRLDITRINAHHFELRLVADDKESDLEANALVEKVTLSVIEDKGTGDAKDIIRLSFRLVCDLTQNVERFACRHFGKTVWLKMQACQGELL